MSTVDTGGEANLVLVVVGDGEARGFLGLGPLAERGEHSLHEAALVPAEVEPGDRGGGGREEHGGEEGGGAARRHRRQRAPPPIPELANLPPAWLVRVGVCRLAAAALPLDLDSEVVLSLLLGKGWESEPSGGARLAWG